MQRAREIREFILLPWDEKKKRAKEYWQKYWRIYLFLFVFAAIIAFINVYIEWLSVKTPSSPRSRISLQSGGVGPDDDKNKENQAVTEPAKNAPTAPNATNNKVIAETAAANDKKHENPEKAAGNTTVAANAKAAGNTTVAANAKAAGNTTAAADAKAAGNTTAAADVKAAGNTTTIIKQTNISNDSRTIGSSSISTDSSSSSSSSKKSEIRERRLAKQSQRPTTSIVDSLSGVGNTMSSALNGGVGKALSVIGMFFSAIIGLFLFCSAPVVLFYMWMKKLIMPLFPSRG